jgi:hypothetical protein
MVRLSGAYNLTNRFCRSVRSFRKRFDLHPYESMIVFGLWAIAFVSGYFGYLWALESLGDAKSGIEIFYMTLQLFFLNYRLTIPPPNIVLLFAQFLAPTLMFSTLLFFLASQLYESFQKFLLKIANRHIIICGLGILGPVLVERFSEEGHTVVVIEKDPRPDEVEQCKSSGALVLTGDASDQKVLKSAGVDRAEYLISVTGKDELNAEIAGCAASIPRKDPALPLTCYLHIVDLNLYTLLKETEFQKTYASTFRLDIFNIYETAGKTILDHPEPFLNAKTDPSTVRLLVIGIGRLGESLIFHAVKSWRIRFGETGIKLPVTIIDRNAEEKSKQILLRYPALEKYCEFQTLTLDITSSEFTAGSFLPADTGRCQFSHIFICVGDPSLGLPAGLTIHKKLQDFNILQHDREVPIVIRTNHETGLSRYLKTLKKSGGLFSNLHAFLLIDENCKVDRIFNTTHEKIARAMHQNYVKTEEEKGNTPKSNPLMKSWDELPEDYKASNRFQADHIIEKLRAISCTVTQVNDWEESLFDISPFIEILAEMEHRRWVDEKIATGWRYGPVRDERWWHKRHPSLIPYKDLPESEKQKDRNAISFLPELLKNVDLNIKQL